jgi:hypothetical protein
MTFSSIRFLKSFLIVPVLIALGSSGIGLTLGSAHDAQKSEILLDQPPVNDNTQTTTVPSSVVEPTTSTTPPPNPGFLDTSNRESTLAAWKAINELPGHKIQWTGSASRCNPGTTNQDFKENILVRVKWFRAMAGVDTNIVLNPESSRLAQEAALVMLANNELSHDPDSSWECFTEDAFEGAQHSNLSLGDYGVESVDGYIEDYGEENISVGHRRWLLDPQLTEIGTGDTTNTNAIWVVNDSQRETFTTREPEGYVMWPPRGYVPRATIFPRWSVSHNKADFSYAQVEIQFQNKKIVIDDPYSDTENIGNLRTLVFEWIRPPKGTGPVIITVSGIELEGTMRTLQYEVRPFG